MQYSQSITEQIESIYNVLTYKSQTFALLRALNSHPHSQPKWKFLKKDLSKLYFALISVPFAFKISIKSTSTGYYEVELLSFEIQPEWYLLSFQAEEWKEQNKSQEEIQGISYTFLASGEKVLARVLYILLISLLPVESFR